MTSYTRGAADLTSQDLALVGFQAPGQAHTTGGQESLAPSHGETGGTQQAPLVSGRESGAPIRPGRQGHIEHIDPILLGNALETIDSIDVCDPYQTPLHLVSLAGSLLAMWETALDSSRFHQDILALLENAVRSARDADTLTDEQVRAMREALIDLRQECLVRTTVDVIRSRFSSAGFAPLAFVDQPEE